MEAIEMAVFTTGWKMWWFMPEELKCLCGQNQAELGFGKQEPKEPTRCRTCAHAIFMKLEDENRLIGIKALSTLP